MMRKKFEKDSAPNLSKFDGIKYALIIKIIGMLILLIQHIYFRKWSFSSYFLIYILYIKKIYKKNLLKKIKKFGKIILFKKKKILKIKNKNI